MIGPFEAAAAVLRRRCGFVPELAIVLGSGLSPLADELEGAVSVPYRELPGMTRSTAPGHRSEAVLGRLSERRVMLLRGRFHAYEGYTMEQVIAPVRLLAALGCRRLLLTNAAGGINGRFRPGDLMVITDHVNLTGMSPLRGLTAGAGERGERGSRRTAAGVPGEREERAAEEASCDDGLRVHGRARRLEGCWPEAMRSVLMSAARSTGVALREGIYGWTSGPSFETPAEIRMAATLGADAVGMSTVPEALAAARLGIRTGGLSLVSNPAAGILEQPITAEEVMETARGAREELVRLVRAFAELLPGETAG